MPVEYLIPSEDGNYTELTNQVGCSSSYQCIDDPINTPDDDTTYVWKVMGASDTARQSVIFPDYQAGGQINSVTLLGRAKNSEAASVPTITPFFRASSMDYDGAAQNLGNDSNYDDFQQVYTTNPATSVAWTYDDLDALEAGMLFTTTGTLSIVGLTQLYAAIDYTPRIDHAVNAGSVIPGVQANWQRVIKRKGVDGVIEYAPWALLTWQIDRLNMALYLELQSLAGQVLTSLTSTDIDRRNFQRTYTEAETSLVQCRHVGVQAQDIRIQFRVGV